MKSRLIYGVVVLGLCSAAATVVGLRLSPTRGISREQAAVPGRRFAHAPSARQRVLERYGRMPLRFEAHPELGRMAYSARGSGYSLLLRPTEAVWALRKSQGRQDFSHLSPAVGFQLAGPRETAHSSPDSAVVRMKLAGANPAAGILGRDRLPGSVNYFLGNDPKKWRSNVPSYAKVHCQNVYPGVDLVYYGNQGQLEFDFAIAPGADPAAIRLHFEADNVELDGTGNLVVDHAGGELVQHAPRIYQEIRGVRRLVRGRYVLLAAAAGAEVGFEVAAYDTKRPLIIDPVLTYSTFLGGRDQDQGHSIAVDKEGNMYVAGWTLSADFPTENALDPTYGGGDGDGFVTKFDPSGSALVYSTYLGGTGADIPFGIAVDADGNAYVAGRTGSPNFPTTPKAFQTVLRSVINAFVTKVDPEGSLVYSTYLGGRSGDDARAIGVDLEGNAYVTGATSSVDFPTANPLQPFLQGVSDAFVTKFDPSGSALVYSTYLGGGGADGGLGIALDTKGNAYVGGQTNSVNFPTVVPFQPGYGGGDLDAFVAKLDSGGGALLYSTYLGGSNLDLGLGIAADSAGSAYVTGWTFSTDFPTVNPFQPERRTAFVTKFDGNGSVVYSTYLGGTGGADIGRAIAADADGNAYVVGDTFSADFPIKDAFQPTFGDGGHSDAFVTEFNADGSALVFSSYLGGSTLDGGFGIVVDTEGNVYVTGLTDSDDFPTRNPFQENRAGHIDAFVTKISPMETTAAHR
jgi:hypothetical protein